MAIANYVQITENVKVYLNLVKMSVLQFPFYVIPFFETWLNKTCLIGVNGELTVIINHTS